MILDHLFRHVWKAVIPGSVDDGATTGACAIIRRHRGVVSSRRSRAAASQRSGI